MVGSSFYISISPVSAVQHGGVKFLYQYQSSTSRLAWWGPVFISVSAHSQPTSMAGSSFYISISPVPAVQHGGFKFLYQYQPTPSRLAWWGPVSISVSVQYQPSSMVGSSFQISISTVSVQHGGVKFLYQYQYSTSRLAWWGQVFISVSVQYQPSSIAWWGPVLYQYQSSSSRLAWWGPVFISVSVQYQPSSMVRSSFISVSVQYQPSSMVGSSFYISISPVPAVQHGGVQFLYQNQSSTSHLAWCGQVFISVSVQYQPSSMVGSSFYITISLVPAVQHGWVKFLYQCQSSTSVQHVLIWGSSFYISISPVPAVQHGGVSFYIIISTVPAVQHGGVKFLYQYQYSTSRLAWWGKFLYHSQSSTSRLAWWGQDFISVSVQNQASSMVRSSFYICISPIPPVQHDGVSFYISFSPVPAVQHGGVKFLYQYQSSPSRLAWWGPVLISVSVQYQPSCMVGSSFYISISPVPAVQHGGSSFYISISPVPAVQHGAVKFLYQYQSSISRLAQWGQVFISVSVQYQSSLVGSSFYISLSPVPAVQHGGVKFLYQYQSSPSRLAWWVQFLYQNQSSTSRLAWWVKFLYQYQYSTSRLAWWGQVFISLSVQYQPSSMVGSSSYISISPVPAVQHGGVKFFISVSVQYQPSSMVGSSFYISISPVPAVQHGGVQFLYQYQYSTSRLAWWGQVNMSVSVQFQPSSMVGSSFYINISTVPAVQHGGASFYITLSPVPADQHGGVKILYQYQSSTRRLAW